ncbi:12352_t:CDS:2 [Acaulospora morrowiae]|uniref:12352_t:CDS:1 n=1 Tax=Acaulospora morrowiae TaxID=94023 RepID=A0A9N8ZJ38_9GLOM|nr:12352_t:CDS:2 [Acaulospora morrowiae]
MPRICTRSWEPNVKSEEVIPIPEGFGPYIIGSRGYNIKKITEMSGAIIYVALNTIPPSIKIYGTPRKRFDAKLLIDETISKAKAKPFVEFSLLEIDSIDKFFDIQYIYTEFKDENITDRPHNNSELREYKQYFLKRHTRGKEMNREEHSIKSKPIIRSDGLGTVDRFEECLKRIFTQLGNPNAKSNMPEKSNLKRIQLRIFFGRQTFLEPDLRRGFISVNELLGKKVTDSWGDFETWRTCGTRRRTAIGTLRRTVRYSTSKMIKTSFIPIPQIWKNIEAIHERFKLKFDNDEDKKRISILYVENGQLSEMKLHWSKEDGSWKLHKVAKNSRRHGTKVPDLQFMVRTEYDGNPDQKISQIIENLQVERSIGDGFRLSDFNGKLDCLCIRQTINKGCYRNDKFKITRFTIQQESRGEEQITLEDNVSVKNICWRKDYEIMGEVSKKYLDKEKLESINETIEFAREFSKSIFIKDE